MRESERDVYKILESKGIDYSKEEVNSLSNLSREMILFEISREKLKSGVEEIILMEVGIADGSVVHVACNVFYTYL